MECCSLTWSKCLNVVFSTTHFVIPHFAQVYLRNQTSDRSTVKCIVKRKKSAFRSQAKLKIADSDILHLATPQTMNGTASTAHYCCTKNNRLSHYFLCLLQQPPISHSTRQALEVVLATLPANVNAYQTQPTLVMETHVAVANSVMLKFTSSRSTYCMFT